MVHIAQPPAAPVESVFVRIPAAALRHGAVNLAQGVFDHGPPAEVLAALAEVGSGSEHQYAPSAGHPVLRAALARRYGPLDPDTEITVCAGATEAYYSTMAALISPGDEAIVVEPAYEQYAPGDHRLRRGGPADPADRPRMPGWTPPPWRR